MEKIESELRFYTSAEIAQILKMNPQVITRKLLAGEIPGYKIGKDWRVSEAQLLEFLERHSNKTQPTDQIDQTVQSFFKNRKLKNIPVTRGKRVPVLKNLLDQLDRKKV